MKFLGIIPARYASTRFPGKPLAVLGGKTVIQRVYEQVAKSLPCVYVATDNILISQAVQAFGGKVVMTRADHQTGTDRVEEAMEKIGGDWEVIVNIQGYEPFIRQSKIEADCRCFDDTATEIATLGKRFTSMDAVENPNSPKIVLDRNGFALYFSRSVIPFIRNKKRAEWLEDYPFLKHLGIYAYRRQVLKEITRLPQGRLEKAESLEQLRWLVNGYHIKVVMTEVDTVGIYTAVDLNRSERFLREQGLQED